MLYACIIQVCNVYITEVEQPAAAVSDLEDQIGAAQWQTEDSVVDVECHDTWLTYDATDTHQPTSQLGAFDCTRRLCLQTGHQALVHSTVIQRTSCASIA